MRHVLFLLVLTMVIGQGGLAGARAAASPGSPAPARSKTDSLPVARDSVPVVRITKAVAHERGDSIDVVCTVQATRSAKVRVSVSVVTEFMQSLYANVTVHPGANVFAYALRGWTGGTERDREKFSGFVTLLWNGRTSRATRIVLNPERGK